MLSSDNTVLVIIDIQGKLVNVMYEKEALLGNIQKLAKGVQIMGVPIVLTEQNPQGLGPTVPELAQILTGVKPIPKFSFNCRDDKNFKQEFDLLNRKQVLLAGIEAHVCIYQTAMNLLSTGYEVQVVADAVSSRALKNIDIALRRMESEGAKLTSTEMVLFELLKAAEGAKFKEMLRMVK